MDTFNKKSEITEPSHFTLNIYNNQKDTNSNTYQTQNEFTTSNTNTNAMNNSDFYKVCYEYGDNFKTTQNRNNLKLDNENEPYKLPKSLNYVNIPIFQRKQQKIILQSKEKGKIGDDNNKEQKICTTCAKRTILVIAIVIVISLTVVALVVFTKNNSPD